MFISYCVCDFCMTLYDERKHDVIVPEIKGHANLSILQV